MCTHSLACYTQCEIKDSERLSNVSRFCSSSVPCRKNHSTMVDKWRTSLLRYTLVHDINDFIGNLSASLFRIVFRKVSQQASARSFLKPFQSAVLYSQTCLGWRFWQLGGFQHSLNQITVRWTDVVDYRNWGKRIRSVCYDEFEFKGFAGSNIGGHLEFDIC